ncbi:phosphatase PAP2 family protein [Antarcticibacterium arcticum]|uniref:Phosphatase PAP2 family protein n=1 Tax=Antarcticibacterium arcticum TaxID=2585771 RepID=A0A5B8YG52_9FLAO|nr:phosphatase PAP2 family protein [Antarcticibacterium arcticum]QED36905.1 phosphatase PAP2 family protein [Antarcticibacterium arcticum]
MRKKIIQILLEIRKLLRDKFHQYNEHLPFILTLFIVLILVVLGINIFISLTETLHSDALAKYDCKITEFVISYRTPPLNKFLQFITEVGDFYGYLVIAIVSTIIFYLKFKNWRYVVEIFFVLIVSGLSNVALKNVINRARPSAEHLVSVETLSYPSGHAMSAIAFYGFLIYLVYTFKLKSWIKIGLIFLFTFLILAIGISRIYLGVHFPSDVVGGYIAGFIWVIFCIVLFHIIDLLRKRRKNRKVKDTD